jgi:hypothetical protein
VPRPLDSKFSMREIPNSKSDLAPSVWLDSCRALPALHRKAESLAARLFHRACWSGQSPFTKMRQSDDSVPSVGHAEGGGDNFEIEPEGPDG